MLLHLLLGVQWIHNLLIGPSAVSVDIDDDEGDDSKNKKTREKRKKDTSKAKTIPVKKQKVSTTKSQKSSSDGGDKAPTRRETLDLDDFGSDDDFDNVGTYLVQFDSQPTCYLADGLQNLKKMMQHQMKRRLVMNTLMMMLTTMTICMYHLIQ